MKLNSLVMGAGSGIGKSILNALQTDQYSEFHSIGFSRSGVPIHKEEDTYLPFGHHAEPEFHFESGTNYKCDVQDQKSTKEFLKIYQEKIGKIDILYGAIGDGLFKPFPKLSKEEMANHFDLNFSAPFRFVQEAIPLLLQSSNPMIVWIASTASFRGFTHSTAYSGSKHAIAGALKSLREEYRGQIRIVIVYAGAIFTSIWDGRNEFNPSDMISESDAGQYLASLVKVPNSIHLEEIYMMPKKGIL
jgi:NAD(P)-dependent dehydrogenase (short-subunit alcohol dehydrogenase family)